MHVGVALELYWQRRNAPSAAGAGVGRLRATQHCFPCAWLLHDFVGSKLPIWCLLAALMGSSVVCIGMFEAMRLSTHVLRSPCTVVGSEVLDIGTCTLCDNDEPTTCEVHPIATARFAVNFKPMHHDENITGWVWYCKGRAASDPCQREIRFLDQLSLDIRSFSHMTSPSGPVPCTAAEVFTFMQRHMDNGEEHMCYYSSRDAKGEDVWLSLPSPGLVDHAWFQKHLEYPVFLALGGLVLLSVLLGCLALEGAELWASGLV